MQPGGAAGNPRATAGAASTEGTATETAAPTAVAATITRRVSRINEEGNPGIDASREAEKLGVVLTPIDNSAARVQQAAGFEGGSLLTGVAADPNATSTTDMAEAGETTGVAAVARAEAAEAVGGFATGRPADGNPGGVCLKPGDGDNMAVVAEVVLQSRLELERAAELNGSRDKGKGAPHQGLASAPPPARRGSGSAALLKGTGVQGTGSFVCPLHDAARTPAMVREELEKICKRARQALEEVRIALQSRRRSAGSCVRVVCFSLVFRVCGSL